MTKDEALKTLAPRAWTKPEYYFGFSPEGDYVVATRHRDSHLLDEHNYGVLFRELGAVQWADDGGQPPPVYDWRASNWAVGWVEYLMVAKNAPAAILIKAAELLKALEAYPILDEDAYSVKEYDAATDTWADLSIKERVELCQDAGVSVFAARHDFIPQEDIGFIFDRCRPE